MRFFFSMPRVVLLIFAVENSCGISAMEIIAP
jgi:hypothetical protein